MLQRAPEISQREMLNYLSSFDMLHYMGSVIGGVMNLLRLYGWCHLYRYPRNYKKKKSLMVRLLLSWCPYKHGNSLLLNWGTKNGWTVAVNQSQGYGKPKTAAWIFPSFLTNLIFFFLDGLKPSLATGLMPS